MQLNLPADHKGSIVKLTNEALQDQPLRLSMERENEIVPSDDGGKSGGDVLGFDHLVLDEKGEEIEFGTFYVGDDRLLMYRIDYHNNSTLSKVYTITDTLPEGLTFVSAENDGVYDEESRTITWQDAIAPDETRFVSFCCQVDPEMADTWESIVDNVGIVSSDLWEDEED